MQHTKAIWIKFFDMLCLILSVPAAGQVQMHIPKHISGKILVQNLACMTTIGISSFSKILVWPAQARLNWMCKAKLADSAGEAQEWLYTLASSESIHKDCWVPSTVTAHQCAAAADSWAAQLSSEGCLYFEADLLGCSGRKPFPKTLT